MDKKSNSIFKYNIFYYDDNNKKHFAYNLSSKELNFIYTRYGKESIFSIEKKNFLTINVPLV